MVSRRCHRCAATGAVDSRCLLRQADLSDTVDRADELCRLQAVEDHGRLWLALIDRRQLQSDGHTTLHRLLWLPDCRFATGQSKLTLATDSFGSVANAVATRESRPELQTAHERCQRSRAEPRLRPAPVQRIQSVESQRIAQAQHSESDCGRSHRKHTVSTASTA